jgi:LPXTG-motif cell wall-anchored protein
MAPTAAMAERDYPTPSSTPTATAESAQVGGAQAAQPVRSGSTLPLTGGEIVVLALSGAGLTGAGVVLVGLGRRRSHAQS